MDSKYKFKLFTSKVSTEEASLETPSSHQLSWRNMFTCVNLLRILNKVVKGKPNRIEVLRAKINFINFNPSFIVMRFCFTDASHI